MVVIFLVNIFRLYLQAKFHFLHNCTRKNLFQSTCYYWDEAVSFREVDQKFLHGGAIGYGDSYLDSVFRYSKLFRPYAIIHDASGAVPLQTSKGPVYCYMIVEVQTVDCLNGLLFCLYVKIFLPTIFNLIDF